VSRLKRYAIGVPLAALGGAGVAMYTSGEPDKSLYGPSEEGGPSLAMRYLSAYHEGKRPMNDPQYPRQKFGGVKTAVWGSRPLSAMPGVLQGFADLLFGGAGKVRKTVSNLDPDTMKPFTAGAQRAMLRAAEAGAKPAVSIVEEAVEQVAPWKRLGMVAAPLAAGVVGLELLDPLSDVIKPVATSAGERMSEQLGIAHSFDDTMWKGIDTLATQGAKELVSGLSGGLQTGAAMGMGALRPSLDVAGMIKTDPVLSQADRSQQQLIHDSYGAMQRVAPSLSAEPFVAKNFLRDVFVTGSGPDHATLSSLAKSEKTIQETRYPTRSRKSK